MVSRDFVQITSHLGMGEPAPFGWRALPDLPVCILVGVTGVGKSTTMAALQAAGLIFHVLPNRRALTDELIIPEMQTQEGEPVVPVVDRSLRFAYTGRYRERYPGGMAHALAQLQVAPGLAEWLLFDGLRGENEVLHAVAYLPRASFVLLEAPDGVRVRRLLGRGDSFDRVAASDMESVESGSDFPASFASLGVPEATALLDAAEEKALLSLVRCGDMPASDLAGKLRIVVAERCNYDPSATRAALLAQAPERTIVVDTTTTTPAEAAGLIAAHLKAGE
jgi:hypothetical protein